MGLSFFCFLFCKNVVLYVIWIDNIIIFWGNKFFKFINVVWRIEDVDKDMVDFFCLEGMMVKFYYVLNRWC